MATFRRLVPDLHGFEHDRGTACLAECMCCGQADLPGADHNGVDQEKSLPLLGLGIVMVGQCGPGVAMAPSTRNAVA